MAAGRHSVVLTEGSTEREFPLAVTAQGQRALRWSPVPWEEEQFGTRSWKIDLHPWGGGLNIDRFTASNTYASSTGDASWDGLFFPGPKLNTLTFTNATNPPKAVEFNGKLYVAGGRYLYDVNSSYTVTETNDFGAGKAITDIAVFENELVIAMGESEKLYTMDTAETFTQATDNTFAVNLAVVDEKLWRSHDTNQVDSATTTVRTLTNWTSANYKVGDTTYTTTWMGDFGGVLWIGKPDGMFQADPASRFHNQIPSLARAPDGDNCKGSFAAGGYLWVPTLKGLYRIRLGSALRRGPEVTEIPNYQFRVRGGFTFDDENVFLLVTDEEGSSNTNVVKLQRRDGVAPRGHEYVYHSMVYTNSTTKGYFISGFSGPTNPTIVFGLGNNGRYFKMGRGGGRDVDDANYEFEDNWSLETGLFAPTDHTEIVKTLVGATVTMKSPSADETMTIAYDVDDAGSYSNMLDTAEGGGSAPISNTSGWSAVTRYAATSTQGQMFQLRMTGVNSTGTQTPTAVLCVRELAAFGYMHPRVADRFQIGIYAGSELRSRDARDPDDLIQLFRRWRTAGTLLTAEIPEYRESTTIRVLVTDGPFVQQASETFGPGFRSEQEQAVVVQLTRVDFEGSYDDA